MATGPEEFGADDFEAVVLAAGSGSRFGGGKLTAPFGGRALIDAAVDAALAAPVRAVTVVTGADPRVGQVLAGRQVRFVEAPDHALGLARSLRAGIAAVSPGARGAFVFLGDMPRIPHTLLPRLAAKVGGGAEAAAPVCGGRRGHPVLFGRRLFPALMALEGDAGAGEMLRALGDRLALVETDDPGVLADVDTPDQLAALANGPQRR